MEEFTLIDFAIKGGWIILIMLILSLIAVTIFIERILTMRRAGKVEEKTYIEILRLIDQNQTDEAAKVCKLAEGSICKILEQGMSYAATDQHLATEAIEQSANQFIRSLEKNLGTLSTFAAVGPMIGFLGTVTGMIRVFMEMQQSEAGVDIQQLSGGIYEAMITTVGGLIVGIICVIFHNHLTSKIENIAFTLESKVSQVCVHLRRIIR